jgi:phage shock protein C
MTQMPSYKRLRRSRTDRMLGGVCGGVANYFGIDPVAARVGFLVLALITGGGALIAYPILWIVMPDEQAAPAWPTPPPNAPTWPMPPTHVPPTTPGPVD